MGQSSSSKHPDHPDTLDHAKVTKVQQFTALFFLQLFYLAGLENAVFCLVHELFRSKFARPGEVHHPDEAPRPQGPRSSGKFWPHTPTSRALLADHRCGSAEGSTMKNCGQIDSKRLRISMDFYGFVTFTRLGIVVSGTHGSRVSLPDGNVHPRSNSIIG